VTTTHLRIRKYFDDLAIKEEDVWYPTPYSWELGKLLDLLDLSGRLVLDAGCGAGNLALTAAAKGATVSACDLSNIALETTKRHAQVLGLKISTQLSDGVGHWLTGNTKFDVIVCNPPSFDLLSHVRGPHVNPFFNSYLLLEVLRDYRFVLNKQGCLLSVVSGKQNMDFVNSIIGRDQQTQPFFIYKKIPVRDAHLLDTKLLTDIGLLGTGADGFHWNAYYFAIFHL
jgi:SAM-dependent methyltransferase